MDTAPTKVCTKCSQEKPVEQFYIKRKETGERLGYCKECHNARTLATYYRKKAGIPKVEKPKPTHKACIGCGVVFPVEDFPINNTKTGQRGSRCRPCKAKKAAEYGAANREKLSKKVTDWQRKNPDRARKIRAKFREVHRDELNVRNRKRYEDDLESKREYARTWLSKNPGKATATKHRAMARILGTGGSYSDTEWEALKAKYEYKCLGCGKQEPEIKLTVDHVIPLRKGGTNDISNIQPLCNSCNSRKRQGTTDFREQRE